jgi:hypothetical protein
MPNPTAKKNLDAARASLQQTITFEEFLAKLSPKDRVNAEKRVAVLEGEPDPRRAPMWQRLVCTLMSLAPTAKFVGKQTVQFFIPDGKYRMQVFAMEDLQDGLFTLYTPNVLEEAMAAGLIAPAPGEPHMHMIPGTRELLRIEPLDKTAQNPAAHYKDMLGWNRKALRITLPPTPSESQVQTAQLVCALAATHFAKSNPQ